MLSEMSVKPPSWIFPVSRSGNVDPRVNRTVSECFNTKIDIRGKLPGNGALSSGVTWPAISDKLTGKHGIDFSTAKLGFRGVSPLTLNRSFDFRELSGKATA